MRTAPFFAAVLAVLAVLASSAVAVVDAQEATFEDLINATQWNTVVQAIVSTDGEIHDIRLNTVDYSKAKKGSALKDELDAYAAALAAADPADVAALTADHDKFYAFYINAYNALAVKTIIESPCETDLFGECAPIASIRDIAYGFWPWEFGVWTRPAGKIAGKEHSLNDVEDLLRNPPAPLSEDSRLHSAIVCASVSCPNLRPSAYTWGQIGNDLKANFNNFLENTEKGMKIDKSKKSVTLSSIFKWFESDFKPTPLKFILAHLYQNNSDYSWLADNLDEVSLEYFQYDWDVNAEKGDVPCPLSNPRPCFRAWHLVLTVVILVTVALLVVSAVCISRKCRKHRDGYHRV